MAALITARLRARKLARPVSRQKEPLGPRSTPAEMRVLELLPTSTYRQIATTLYISLNTVKTHIRSVYQKLGVTSRSSAVKRAASLGLL